MQNSILFVYDILGHIYTCTAVCTTTVQLPGASLSSVEVALTFVTVIRTKPTKNIAAYKDSALPTHFVIRSSLILPDLDTLQPHIDFGHLNPTKLFNYQFESIYLRDPRL